MWYDLGHFQPDDKEVDFSKRTCRNKKKFASKEACEKSITREKADVPLKPYLCGICAFWHKTKQTK